MILFCRIGKKTGKREKKEKLRHNKHGLPTHCNFIISSGDVRGADLQSRETSLNKLSVSLTTLVHRGTLAEIFLWLLFRFRKGINGGCVRCQSFLCFFPSD